MIKNILADVMVGFGIIILVIGMLFVFDIWPVSGESKQQIKQAENNTEQEYFTQKQMPKFNTNFAWERNLPFNINNINLSNDICFNIGTTSVVNNIIEELVNNGEVNEMFLERNLEKYDFDFLYFHFQINLKPNKLKKDFISLFMKRGNITFKKYL